MIYFDENKQAYAFEIENSTATIEDELWANYAGKDNWDIVDGVFIDISQNQEYKDKIEQAKNAVKKTDWLNQIDEIDKKRIRAIAEPQLKDGESGQTWLEFYTEQIQELRTQIANI